MHRFSSWPTGLTVLAAAATTRAFSRHFSGQFHGRTGQGQPIDFIATDIYRVQDGRIAENWHLADNLTLARQMGLLAL